MLLLLVVIAALLVEPSLAVAHDIGYAHTDPAPAPKDSSASAPSEVVILIGVVFTLVTISALVWLKNHDFGADIGRSESAAE